MICNLADCSQALMQGYSFQGNGDKSLLVNCSRRLFRLYGAHAQACQPRASMMKVMLMCNHNVQIHAATLMRIMSSNDERHAAPILQS